MATYMAQGLLPVPARCTSELTMTLGVREPGSSPGQGHQNKWYSTSSQCAGSPICQTPAPLPPGTSFELGSLRKGLDIWGGGGGRGTTRNL